MYCSSSSGIPVAEVRGAIEATGGADVFPGEEGGGSRLVEGVGVVDAIPAEVFEGVVAC